MASQWFYQATGRQVGPISSAELRNLAQRGVISTNTLVKNAPGRQLGASGTCARVVSRIQQKASADAGYRLHPSRDAANSFLRFVQPWQPSNDLCRSARLSRHAVAIILAGSLALVVLIGAIIVATTRSHDQRHEAESAQVSKATPPAGTPSESGQASKAAFAVGTPEYVVEQYTKATSWQERLQYVKQTKGIKEKMSQHYRDRPTRFEYDQIKKCDSAGTAVASVVTVDVVNGTIFKEISTYYLERTSQGYLILWEPSVNWLPMGWKPYIASRSERPMDFPLLCTLDTSYYATREEIKNTHYSLSIRPPKESHDIQAFVVRSPLRGRRYLRCFPMATRI